MISEVLLSEVFNQEVRFIRYVANNTYEIHFEKPIRLKYIIINIYELAHKCKEWAWDKGYGFESLPFAEKIFNRFNASDLMSFDYSNEDRKDKIPYKIKYLFKACQWILDNKED